MGVTKDVHVNAICLSEPVISDSTISKIWQYAADAYCEADAQREGRLLHQEHCPGAGAGQQQNKSLYTICRQDAGDSCHGGPSAAQLAVGAASGSSLVSRGRAQPNGTIISKMASRLLSAGSASLAPPPSSTTIILTRKKDDCQARREPAGAEQSDFVQRCLDCPRRGAPRHALRGF